MNIKPITVAATRPSIHGDSSSMKYNGSNQRNTKTKFKQIQKQKQKQMLQSMMPILITVRATRPGKPLTALQQWNTMEAIKEIQKQIINKYKY